MDPDVSITNNKSESFLSSPLIGEYCFSHFFVEMPGNIFGILCNVSNKSNSSTGSPIFHDDGNDNSFLDFEDESITSGISSIF